MDDIFIYYLFGPTNNQSRNKTAKSMNAYVKKWYVLQHITDTLLFSHFVGTHQPCGDQKRSPQGQMTGLT